MEEDLLEVQWLLTQLDETEAGLLHGFVGEGTPAELGARLGRSTLEDIFLDLVRDDARTQERA